MSVDPNNLKEYEGKQVVLHFTPEDSNEMVELEGKVEAASVQGMAFKEKGKRDVVLIEPSQIEEIDIAPDKPKPIAQKKLKPVSETGARQHLVDRHGMPRSAANKLNDEDAFKMHEEIDHADLGHKHVAAEDDEEDASTEDAAA